MYWQLLKRELIVEARTNVNAIRSERWKEKPLLLEKFLNNREI